MTKLANCLLRQVKDFKNFDESEVVEASKIYQSRGKSEDAANIAAIEDHLDDLRTQRKAIVDHVLEQFKVKEPARYAKIAAANRPIVAAEAPLTEKERGIAMVAEGIDELISLLGGKTNMLPEEEARLIPIMSKIFRGAAIAGYATFKDSARWVYNQIHAKSPEVAAKLSIENLQAGFINVSKEIGGDKKAALDFDSIEQLMADDAKISEAIDAAAHEAATSPLNDKPQPTGGQKAANNYEVGSIPASATAIGMPISIENPQGSIRWKLDTDRLKAIAQSIIDNRHNSAEARKPALAMLDALAEITGADVTKVEGGFDRLQTAIDGLIRNFPVQQETAQEIFDAGWKNKMQQHYGYILGVKGRDKDNLDIFLAPGADTASKVWVIDQKNKDGSFDEHKVVLGPETEAEARAAYLANYQPGWDGIGAITSMPVPAFKAWAGDGKPKRNPLAYVEEQAPKNEAAVDSQPSLDDLNSGKALVDGIKKEIAKWVANATNDGTREMDRNWERGAVKRFVDANVKAHLDGKQTGNRAAAKIAVAKSETFADLSAAIEKMVDPIAPEKVVADEPATWLHENATAPEHVKDETGVTVAELFASNFIADGQAMREMFDIPSGKVVLFGDLPSVMQDEVARQVGDVLPGEEVTIRQPEGGDERVLVEVAAEQMEEKNVDTSLTDALGLDNNGDTSLTDALGLDPDGTDGNVVVNDAPKRTSFGGHRAWDFGGVLVVGVKNPHAGGLSHFAFHLADGNGGWKRLEAVGDGLDGSYADGPGNPPSRQNIIRHLKERSVPVAESLAPAPSEPGDAGVATGQGGAAADNHWLHDEIVNLIHFKGRTQNRRALDKIVELLKRRAAGEDIRNGKIKSHVSGFKNEAALIEVLNRIVTRLETEDKETTAAKRKETAQAKKETAENGNETAQAQQGKPEAPQQGTTARRVRFISRGRTAADQFAEAITEFKDITIPELPGRNFFIHAGDNGQTVITERETGKSMARGDTERLAYKALKDVLASRPAADIEKIIAGTAPITIDMMNAAVVDLENKEEAQRVTDEQAADAAKSGQWDGQSTYGDKVDTQMREGDIGAKKNKPYASRAAAVGWIFKNKASDTHEVVQVGKSEFVLRPIAGAQSAAEKKAEAAHKAAVKAAEVDAFNAMVASQDLINAEANTQGNFMVEAQARLVKWLGAEMFAAANSSDTARVKALDSLLKDGKPVLPESFFESARAEIKKQAKLAKLEGITAASRLAAVEAIAKANILGDQGKVMFLEGWDHALAGKTKSTLSSDEIHHKGYEAARAWMKTPEGSAAFTGKRAKKLENTGVDLRRWFDEQKAKIDTATDTDSVINALDAATTRAELFRSVLDEGATPGAQRWLEGLRNQVYPFKRWLTERGPLGIRYGRYYSRRTSDTEIIRGYLNSEVYQPKQENDTKEQRIAVLKSAAEEYVNLVRDITENIQGKTVTELSQSFEALMLRQDIEADMYKAGDYSPIGTRILPMFFRGKRAIATFAMFKRGPSYQLRNLIENEARTDESTRKAALTPPRLDRVERDGEDFRSGQNVSPESFKRTFNFADVGFGKWVGAKQDQDHLNYSFDAFGDLAKLIGIPPAAISLGGRLHFTIGALGHGKFAAHYAQNQPSPDGGTVPVINVTNTRGDGTVAHEWSHALDLTPQDDSAGSPRSLRLAIEEIKRDLKYAYNFDTLRASVVQHLKGERWWRGDKRAVNTDDGKIDNARRAIDYYSQPSRQMSAYYRAAMKLDGSKGGKKDAYWSNDKELFARAFEGWVGDALETSNTYLVNPEWSGEGMITEKTHRGTPYPVGAERERIAEWMDALRKSLVYDDENKILMLDPHLWSRNKPNHAEEWTKALNDLSAEIPAMLEAIKREQKFGEEAAQAAKEHAASFKAGDWVRPRDGRETRLREKIGDEPAEIDGIKTSGDGTIYVTVAGYDFNVPGVNLELVQTKEQHEAQIAKARADEIATPSPAAEPVGELSADDIEAAFNEAAAELAESTQEQPAAPAPGEAVSKLADGWTDDDIAFLRKKVEDGQIILLASADLGLPTIHDMPSDKTHHLGFGVFRTSTPYWEGTWEAGGAMQHTPGGHAFTTVSMTRGEIDPTIFDKDGVLNLLQARGENKQKAANLLSGRGGRIETDAERAARENAIPSLDEQADKTAAGLAAEAAKLGVKGIDEAMKGLVKLFGGGPGKLQSFPAGMDEDSYKQAKPHFEAALKAFQEAGKTIKDLFKFLIEQFGMGIKPYALHFAKEMQLSADLGQSVSANRKVANFVLDKLSSGADIRWQDLFAAADKAFGGTQAAGTYTVKDAYDAMEMGVNLYLEKGNWTAAGKTAEAARRDITNLGRMIAQLPTQTKRTAEMDEFQQFSTPPTLAYAANWVANVRPGESMMEPSAGTGDLAIFAHNAGAGLILNELSSRRAAILKELFPRARVFTENAEQLNNVLPADAVPTVTVMNPPFSSTAGRKQGSRDTMNGARHIEQALKRLDKGGRLVAIVGEGMAADRPAFKEWWRKIAAEYNVRANIGISGKEYAKYGTTFDNQILVIDKNGPTINTVVTGKVETVAELPALLEGIRNDRPQANAAIHGPESVADQQEGDGTAAQGGAGVVASDGAGSDASDAVGSGKRPASTRPGRPGNADSQSGAKSGNEAADGDGQRGRPESDAAERPGGSSVAAAGGTDGVAPGATGVTLGEAEKQKQGELTDSVFENYRPQRLEIKGAHEHPGKLVQSAAMAAVEPPAPTYTPNLPAEVITKGMLSNAQLESVVYAGQSHEQFLPNGERRGILIGDGCVAGETRIYDPETGNHVAIKDLAEAGKPIKVLSFTGRGFVVAEATAPFMKGEEALYKVTLESGRSVLVTDNHRFFTPSGWRRIVDGLIVGHSLASAEGHPASSLGFSPSTHGEDALRLFGKPQDCLARYCEDSRRRGVRLLEGVGNVQEPAPLQDGVLEHTHDYRQTDVRELSPKHTHQHPLSDHHSRSSFSPLESRDLSLTSGQAGEGGAQLLAERRQVDPRSHEETASPHQLDGEAQGGRQALSRDLSLIDSGSERHASSGDTKPSTMSRRTLEQDQRSSPQGDKNQLQTELSRKELTYKAFASDYDSRWDRITSIEFVRVDKFYDMWVPGTENYVAEGIVHHNTGVGKGREISGIILDNMRQGRNKAVWVSANEGLMTDAGRDFSGVGGDPGLIFFQGKTKAGGDITAKKGILFTTYPTLRGGEKKQATDTGGKQGKRRIDQLVKWLGDDFDGVIVFDEAHAMGNVVETKGKRGKKKASAQALAGVNLQKQLPKARIVYVSATGATEVNNLGYGARLGLWGEGTAFPGVKEFVGKIMQGGVAAMELISRDMKALGMYISRSLSFDGVTYERLDHNLTPLQTDIYNELAKTWQVVLQNVEAALDITNQAKDGNAKSAAMSRFWGTHQRFFNQVITSMQTPTVIEDMRKQIEAGNAVLIQLVNTNEAEQERQAARAQADGVELEELDFTPRQALMDYVRNAFPVQAYQESTDADGNTIYTPVMDAAGNPVFDQDAIRMRDELLANLEAIRVPENPIDAIINAFGSDKVGEVTGRGRRFVQTRDEDGNLKIVEEKRGKHAAQNDAIAFQSDKKPILIFSQAGGTGFSFHADNTAKNQRKRIHYILQPGWRADSAVQGFGRSHRTNQAQPPHYVLPTTNLKAQKRFVSSIARRLDQLGALTRGQRQATSQGLFTASDNLESKYADDALEVFFQDMYRGSTPLVFSEVTRAMGLNNLIDPKTGSLSTTNLPEIPRFLNRLLSLSSTMQDEVFGEFEKRLEEIVNFAIQQGTYDNGMQTLKAESVKKVRDDVAYTDERTGAETRYVEIDVTNPIKYRSFENAENWSKSHGEKFVGWFKNAKGDVFGIADLGDRVNADGEVHRRGAVIDIKDHRLRYVDNLKDIKQGWAWGQKDGRSVKKTISTPIDASAIQAEWEKQVAEAPKHETRREHMIVGVILPVWDRVEGHPRIYRLQTDEGERMIGRVMGPKDAAKTLKNLGLGSSVSKMAPTELLAAVKRGARAILGNGWEISKAGVSGDTRIEIKTPSGYFSGGDQSILKDQGVFFERISFRERAFIPTGADELKTFERVVKAKPVVDLFEAGQNTAESPVMGYNDPYEQLETRPGTTEAQKQVGLDALRDAERTLFGRAADGMRWGRPSVLGLALNRDFREDGGTSFTGQQVSHPRDLAAMAQVLRDPRFETFRVFYTKGDTIVGQATFSSRLPGVVYLTDKFQERVAAGKQRFDADGYWMMHNHPAGKSRPSRADMVLTSGTAEAVPGFKGHVIIDHNEYTSIAWTDDNGARSETIVDSTLGSMDMRANSTVPSEYLDARLGGPAEAVELAKRMQVKDGFIVVIGTDAALRVAVVLEIPEAAATPMSRGESMRNLAMARRLKSSTGVHALFAVVPGNYKDGRYSELLKSRLFVDVIGANGSAAARGEVSGDVPLHTTSDATGNKAKKWFVEEPAYHGTPHEVDRFSTGKIGTGEGAQAYGWGLYFASSKAVAKHYKERLSEVSLTMNGKPISAAIWATGKTPEVVADAFASGRLVDALRYTKGADGKAIAAAAEKLAGEADKDARLFNDPAASRRETLIAVRLREFASAAKAGQMAVARGRLYSVELAPEPDEYLLWDKPLSEQSEKVKAAIEVIKRDKAAAWSGLVDRQFGGPLMDQATGRDLYKRLAAENDDSNSIDPNGDRAASEYLHSIGIRGIKYLDGVSRNRPLREIKREFLAELPEDADFAEVKELLGTGTFSPTNEAVIKALQADDWLGFDYPAQALSAALGDGLKGFDASKALKDAVEAAQDGSTYNYVIFDENDVVITGMESRGNFAYTEDHELPNRNLDGTLDAAALRDLRREAAGLESPERGTFLTITEDGRAVATGQKGTRVPESFTRFAQKHGLTFDARRIAPGNGAAGSDITPMSEPMPIEYRESGAMYFGEAGSFIDRNGKTRFSKSSTADFTGYNADEIRDGLIADFGGKAIRQLEANGLLSILENPEALQLIHPGVAVSNSAKAVFIGDRAYFFANRMRPESAKIELLHEIGEHYGLERLLGKDGYSNLIQHVKELRDNGDIHAAKAWDFVARNYPEEAEGSRRFMHEVLAQLGQNADIQSRPWWKELLEKVKRALVRMGFTGMIKVSDIQDMVLHSLKVAAEPQGGPGGGIRGSEMANTAMAEAMASMESSALETASRRMSKFVDAFLAGQVKPEDTQILGDTPFVLQALGAKPMQMQIDGDTIKKVLGDKHRYFITVEMLKSIPEHLYNPLAIFDSPSPKTGEPGKLILTELSDAINGSPVVVAVHLSKVSGRMVINEISSIYGADAGTANRKMTAEDIEYFRNAKSLEQSTIRGLNTPLADMVQSAQDSGKIVLSQDDVVKQFGALYSQRGFGPVDTGSAEFKRWFGDSKVVSEGGKPLVVYHGAPDARFMNEDATFKTVNEKYGSSEPDKRAFWFASDRRTANTYADDRRAFDYQNAEPGIIAAYIKLDNPLIVDAEGKEWRSAQQRGKTSDVIALARTGGHDGVIIRNVKDDYNNHNGTPLVDTYVVFSSNQIKSAEKNTGAFDPTNPDIRYSRLSSSWTDERIDSLLRKYAYNQDDTKTKAFAGWIDPLDFLMMTSDGPDYARVGREAGPLDVDRLRTEDQELFLEVGNIEAATIPVAGHEGRHRAMALMHAGIRQIPVVIYLRDGAIRNANPVKSLFLNSQRFGPDSRGMGGGFVSDLVPISYEYADRLRSEFSAEADVMFSRAGYTPEAFAANVVQELSAENDLFRHPISHSGTIKGVMADVYPAAKYLGDHAREDETAETGANHRYVFQNHLGKRFDVYSTDSGRVWLDVSKLANGDGGNQIYAAVANWAYNTRKVFQGDPLGVSADATIRRTSNMLSSAVRFGTTRHLDASPEQRKGKPDAGVEPLQWGGNDIDNLRELIHTFTKTLYNKFPTLATYHYDFAKRGFFDKNGKPVTRERFAAGARTDFGRDARSGEGSLRRGVFLKSLMDEASRGHESQILQLVLTGAGPLVEDGELRGMFSRGNYLDDDLGGAADALRNFPRDRATAAQRSPDQWFKPVLDGVLSSFKGSSNFGALDRSIHTQLHKAQKNRYFGETFKRVQHFMEDASRAALRPAELAPTVLPRIDAAENVAGAFKALLKGKEASADINAAFGAALTGTLDDVVYADAEQAGLTPEQFSAYREIRDAADASLDELSAAEAWGIARTLYLNAAGKLTRPGLQMKKALLESPGQAKSILLDRLIADLEDAKLRFDQLAEIAREKAPFVTGTAVENLRAAMQSGIGNMDQNQAIAAALEAAEQVKALDDTVEKVAQLLNRRDQLQREGYVPLMRFGQHYLTVSRIDPTTGEIEIDENGEKVVEYFGLFESAAERDKAAKAMRELYPEEASVDFDAGTMSEEEWQRYKGVSPETVALFAGKLGIGTDEVFQEWYRLAASNRSTLKRLIHRKGTPGFSEDGARVMASFLTSNGRRASMLYHMADIQESIDDFPRQQGAEKDEAIRMVEYIQNPDEEAATPRALLFMHFLGGTVSNFLINATQPAMVTLPYVSQFVGMKRATELMKDAYRIRNKPEAMSQELRDALARADQEGKVGAQEIHHLWQETARPLANQLGRFGDAVTYRAHAFMSLWGMPFAIAEHMNRQVTFITAYNAAKEQGSTPDQAYSKAIQAIDETQFIYGKNNRPNWARGNIGAVVFTFRLFSISYTELLVRMLRQNPESRKAALYMLGMLILASGLQGLPGSDDLDDLIDTIGQAFGYNINSRLAKRKWIESVAGKQLASFAMHGLSALTPLDVSGRMSLGNLVPGTALFKASNSRKEADLLEIVGPAGGLAMSYINTWGAVATGNWSRAATEWMPKAAKDMVRGVEMAVTGEALDQRGRKVVDVNPFEALVKAAGFNPQAIAEVGRNTRDVQQKISFARRTENLIAEHWARGIVDGKAADIAAAREAIAEWNATNPETPISVRYSAVAKRAAAMRANKSDRFIKAATKEMRDYAAEAIE